MDRTRLTRTLTAAFLALMLLGAVALPLLEVRTLWLFKDNVTLANVVWTLMTENDFALGLLILLLGIVAPFGKCALLAAHDLTPGSKARRVFQALNVFSSLDAFLIALTIFLMKMAEVSKPQIEIGMAFLIVFIVASKLAEIALLPEKDQPAP